MAHEGEGQVRWLSRGVVAVTGTLWALTPLAFLVAGDVGRALVSGILLGGLLVVYARIVVRRIKGAGPGHNRMRIFACFVLIVYGALPFLGSVWIYTPFIVATAGLLLLRFRPAAGVLLAVAVAEFPLSRALQDPSPEAALQNSAGVFVAALVAFWLVRYATSVRELRDVRAALAEAAVDQDRTRMAAELHDLLGQTLASITLKTELALALMDLDRRRAVGEVESAVAIAGEAREQIGDVVAARRSLDVGAELSAAIALIELTGARCDLRVGISEIDEETGDTLGWIVREAATNIVRHSDARHCLIELDTGEGRIHLLVRNDGARREAGRRRGSGLAGLRRRVDRLGGSLHAGPAGDDGFEVRVWLPAVHDQERVVTVDSCPGG
ncbi:sensor histidine kinase [Nonomuraea sp. CA-141351]|uniref:sensor histidine kinase n=1 Tax=Nonomuraea sp. CA-141351 TaxID=3239996 RepID=UPI003D8A50E5